MRRSSPRSRGTFAGLALLAILAAAPAFGQVPQPREMELNERSGLVQRFTPIQPHLPPDPLRDTFYDTRFGNAPNIRHPLKIKNGGLYGLYWKPNHTAAVFPFFYGSPGENTVTPDSYPWPRPLRVIQSFVHPFKPVGMYYDQGCYVPIHDLHPLVPGPGPYPWPWYFNPAIGG